MEKEEGKVKRLSKKQKVFLKIFDGCSCNVSIACNQLHISRRTYYDWRDSNPKFKEESDAVRESLIDYAESKLHTNIKDGKEASIFFFLKTQAKSRGYIETIDQQVSVNPFEELMKAASSSETEVK